MHDMVILGGHASTEHVNSIFRGNPYLITKLYSLEYKVSRVWCMWVARKFHSIFYNFDIVLDCFSRTKHHIKIGKMSTKPRMERSRSLNFIPSPSIDLLDQLKIVLAPNIGHVSDISRLKFLFHNLIIKSLFAIRFLKTLAHQHRAKPLSSHYYLLTFWMYIS